MSLETQLNSQCLVLFYNTRIGLHLCLFLELLRAMFSKNIFSPLLNSFFGLEKLYNLMYNFILIACI